MSPKSDSITEMVKTMEKISENLCDLSNPYKYTRKRLKEDIDEDITLLYQLWEEVKNEQSK